jgi:hypothetical protein
MAETVVVAVVNEAVEVAPGAAVICVGLTAEAIEAEVTSLMLVRPAMLATHDHSGGGEI